MSIKETIDRLKEGKTPYAIAKRYGELRDGHPPKRPDQYGTTVRRVLERPEECSFENVALVLQALGLDLEAAIAIAASQVKPNH